MFTINNLINKLIEAMSKCMGFAVLIYLPIVIIGSVIFPALKVMGWNDLSWWWMVISQLAAILYFTVFVIIGWKRGSCGDLNINVGPSIDTD